MGELDATTQDIKGLLTRVDKRLADCEAATARAREATEAAEAAADELRAVRRDLQGMADVGAALGRDEDRG